MIPFAVKKSKSYHKQKVCYICKKGFSTDDDNQKYHKVKGHCHYSGKYRGVAHNICNLRYKTKKEIPEKNLKVSLNVQEKMQKNISLFQYQLKKKLIMLNPLNTK